MNIVTYDDDVIMMILPFIVSASWTRILTGKGKHIRVLHLPLHGMLELRCPPVDNGLRAC